MTHKENELFKVKAHRIYDLFMKENSKLWVNFSYTIIKKMHKAGFREGYNFSVLKTQEVFLDALNSVYTLMKCDTFSRFRYSELYAEFCFALALEKTEKLRSSPRERSRVDNAV